MKTRIVTRGLVICAAALAWNGVSAATAADAKKPAKSQAKSAAKPQSGPKPTLANVPYGPHPKQVLDFYKAESSKPTPVVFYIHGGGWMGGKKAPFNASEYLKAGISVVSIEYRFIPEATADKVVPPVKGPLTDAARALQFVRSKAAEWNIDKTRIGATGGSAGACSSLWLAFHDDMADPKSSDPIARESTRLTCAAVNVAQTSLDPKQMKEWTPNSRYGGHAFGFTGDKKTGKSQFQEFLEGGRRSCRGSRNTRPTNWSRRTIRPSSSAMARRLPWARSRMTPRTPPILASSSRRNAEAWAWSAIWPIPAHGPQVPRHRRVDRKAEGQGDREEIGPPLVPRRRLGSRRRRCVGTTAGTAGFLGVAGRQKGNERKRGRES